MIILKQNSFLWLQRSYAWPWRTSSFNEWGGLRIEFNVRQSEFPNASRPLGLLFSVHDPYEWPNIARFVPAGSTSAVRIYGTAFYVSPEVRNLDIHTRKCVHNEERVSLNMMFLHGLPYLRPNCISACRRYHMMKFCNCSMDILFPDNDGEVAKKAMTKIVNFVLSLL